ncbi:MAG: Lrp/AsnC ligand binding domain-containing protein [Thermofilum sp.]
MTSAMISGESSKVKLTEKQMELLRFLFNRSKPLRVHTVELSQRKISSELGISRQALNIHLRRLRELKFVRTGRGFIDVTDRALSYLGRQEGEAFIFLRLDPPKRLQAYDTLKKLPVDKVFRVTGDIDVIIQVSQSVLDEVLNTINTLDGVRETRTYVVIETLK